MLLLDFPGPAAVVATFLIALLALSRGRPRVERRLRSDETDGAKPDTECWTALPAHASATSPSRLCSVCKAAAFWRCRCCKAALYWYDYIISNGDEFLQMIFGNGFVKAEVVKNKHRHHQYQMQGE